MRILIIEDDVNLNNIIKYQLEKEGYQVESCFDGREALRFIRQQFADLILLDRMLPHISGMELLKELRNIGDSTPVLMLTALGTLSDRVEGLNMGADDYLVKPFAMEELMARIRSLSRRVGNNSPNSNLVFGDISYKEITNELSGPLGRCTLSQREGALMEVLIRSNGQTLNRSQLINNVWGLSSEVEDGNLDNYIFFLRRRLKGISETVSIQTVRGVGYHLE